MASTSNKRKRDPTFIASEKMALLDLVQKHFHIVVCKKTDALTSKNKISGWQKIAEEFNAVSPIHPRDWSVLKNCWENLKKKAKSEQTARNQHYLGTGGGPPRKLNADAAIERVLELIHSRVSGYVNQYDSDGTQILASGTQTAEVEGETEQATQEYLMRSNDASTSESQVQDRESTEATETAATLTVDSCWSQYTPMMLRLPVSSALVSRSPSPEASENRVEPTTQHQQASTTPLRACVSTDSTTNQTTATSRRRPTLRRNRDAQIENLNSQRITTLLKADTHAEEEHMINVNILRLREQREQEMLKQERIKTQQEEIKLEILKLELKKLQVLLFYYLFPFTQNTLK